MPKLEDLTINFTLGKDAKAFLDCLIELQGLSMRESYFACPKAEHRLEEDDQDPSAPAECNRGAEEHNRKVREVFDKILPLLKGHLSTEIEGRRRRRFTVPVGWKKKEVVTVTRKITHGEGAWVVSRVQGVYLPSKNVPHDAVWAIHFREWDELAAWMKWWHS